MNLHFTAYFIATTVFVTQLSIIVAWYNNILHGYCENASFPILEKFYSLLFPVIYIRFEVWRLNNVKTQLERKIKESLTKISNDPSNQMISSQYTKLVLKLNKMKEKALNAKRIQCKILNLRLVFGDFPQSIVNIALLILATKSGRLEKYLVQTSIVNDGIKSQISSFFRENFQYFIAALVIKTIIGIVLVVIKNRRHGFCSYY